MRLLVLAPGAGLGHLTRASALALELERMGVPTEILSDSPFCPWVAEKLHVAIRQVPTNQWHRALDSAFGRRPPDLVVVDTFPWGPRGQWAKWQPPVPALYLARRLRVDRYLAAARCSWDTRSPLLRNVIVLEPLSPRHDQLVRSSADNILRLSGRICLPEEACPDALPPCVLPLLDRGPYWLVVHSGPRGEVAGLVAAAKRQMLQEGGSRPLVVVSPTRGVDGTLRLYPALGLLASADRVFSGAGYNIVAEMRRWPAKHVAVPFPREFDDQSARILGPPMSSADGRKEAAEFVLSLL